MIAKTETWTRRKRTANGRSFGGLRNFRSSPKFADQVIKSGGWECAASNELR